MSRRRWLFRAALIVFLLGNALAALRAYGYYEWARDYCKPENAAVGGSGLDCLEPADWLFVVGAGLAWIVLAGLLATVTVIAFFASRDRRAKPQP